ncbi:MAG: MFS transporter, partial [Actinomycetota bacterium]
MSIETNEPVDLATAADAGASQRDPSFIQKGKVQASQLFKEAANYKELKKTPYGLKPILILTIVGAILAFDGSIFALVLPDVTRELKVDVVTVLNVLGLVNFLLIFGGLAIAFYADRVKRTWLVGGGAILNGIGSIFTSRAHTVGVLGVSRATDRVGSVALGTPVGSMLADYYPPESRGKAFALQALLGRFAPLVAPIAIAAMIKAASSDFENHPNWRFPFLITGPLLVITGIAVIFLLDEPIRGYMERRALGASEEVAMVPEESVSFGEAWRISWSIRTLRRLFMSDIVASAGDLIFASVFAFYLQERYGLDIKQRAFLTFVIGLVALPFWFLAGGMVDVLIRRRPQRVLILTGLLSLASAVAVFGIALGPPKAGLFAIFVIFAAATALVGPARSVLFVQIIPANVRALGLSVRALSLVPAYVLVFAVNNTIITRYGVRGALFATVPFILIGAFIELSAAGFFERDMRSATAASLASDEFRRAKESGTGKLLVCRDIDVEYDGVQVLFGVDFDVEVGQIIALLGTNGAGKSTLLRAISGTQEASSGAIVCDGRDITHMPPHEIARRGIIHMPGGKGTFPGLTVKENLLLGNWLADPEEGTKRLEEVYEIFPSLKQRQNEKANLLSGGEQQMLSLAQAFLGNPKLLMIDELSLGLSPAVVQQLIEIVRDIHKRGVTIIIVEQSVNVALTVADRAIFMEKGEVKFSGLTKDLLTRPDILRAVYVKGSGALMDGAPTSAMKSERELRRYELDRANALLEVKDLRKSFGGVHAVNGVSFELKEGESLGLIGPNGAG